MTITFYGEGCFKIQSGDLTILTDPFKSETGLTPPRFRADILLKTIISFPFSNQLINQPAEYLIYGPGEYNIKNINIFGFGLIKESANNFLKTAYLTEVEGIKLCFLGHLSEIPEPSLLEHLEEIDILFIPAGGSPFIEQKSAIKLIKQIEPKIVIPSFYKIPQLKRKTDDLKIFFEEFNHKEKIEPKEKLIIRKKDLEEIKKTEITVLSKF